MGFHSAGLLCTMSRCYVSLRCLKRTEVKIVKESNDVGNDSESPLCRFPGDTINSFKHHVTSLCLVVLDPCSPLTSSSWTLSTCILYILWWYCTGNCPSSVFFLESHWLGLNLLLMDLLQLQEEQCSEIVISPASRSKDSSLCCNVYYSMAFL